MSIWDATICILQDLNFWVTVQYKICVLQNNNKKTKISQKYKWGSNEKNFQLAYTMPAVIKENSKYKPLQSFAQLFDNFSAKTAGIQKFTFPENWFNGVTKSSLFNW